MYYVNSLILRGRQITDKLRGRLECVTTPGSFVAKLLSFPAVGLKISTEFYKATDSQRNPISPLHCLSCVRMAVICFCVSDD